MAPRIQTTLAPGPATVPVIYRLILTTIEPFFAISGALQALCNPAEFMSTMTRGAGFLAADSTFLYTELGGAWLYFAFVEIVVLRVFDDVRLWRFLCAGMLLSDLTWCLSAAEAVGGWPAWADLGAWTTQDHLIFWTSAPIALIRILIVLGVGMRRTELKK